MRQALGAALGGALYLYSSTGNAQQGGRFQLYLAGIAVLAMTLTSILVLTMRAAVSYRRKAVYVVKSKMIVRSEVIHLDPPRDMVIVLDEPTYTGLLALANA